MNTTELLYCMQTSKILKKVTTTVLPLNELSSFHPTREEECAIIVNLAPIPHPGIHWVSIHLLNGHAVYFDPLGNPIQKKEIKNFVEKNAKTKTINNFVVQGRYSSLCGQFCIFFLEHRCIGMRMRDIVEMFTKSTRKNDAIVQWYFLKRFGSIKCSGTSLKTCVVQNSVMPCNF